MDQEVQVILVRNHMVLDANKVILLVARLLAQSKQATLFNTLIKPKQCHSLPPCVPQPLWFLLVITLQVLASILEGAWHKCFHFNHRRMGSK